MMQSNRKLDRQTRAILMATGGAAIAAVAAMSVPVGLWEMLTGATGISEMIPATGAPLGDTARALISFAFGALTFAVLSVMLLRRKASPKVAPTVLAAPIVYEMAVEETAANDEDDEEEAERPSMVERLKGRMSAFVDSRRNGDDISGLEDLPKLRSGDAHPDAPPRRPLLATRDLVDIEPEAATVPTEAEAVIENSPEPEIETEAPADVAAEESPTEAAVVAPDRPEAEVSPESLAAMVNQLEANLVERDERLARLEALVLEASAANAQPLREVQYIADAAPAAPLAQPVLESANLAPSPPTQPSDEAEAMDAALRSALETLHRMNARTR